MGLFLHWVKYYAHLHQTDVLAIAPQFTSQDCSCCGTRVKKALSVRTHVCTGCGVVLDRDENAARNILIKALVRTVGQTGTGCDLFGGYANASGQMAATEGRAISFSKPPGMKEESPVL